MANLNRKNLVRNVWLLEVMTVIDNAIFILPVIYVYYAGKGLSLSEFYWVQAIFALSAVLFEVPSGYLSDIWRRKNILLIGSVFGLLGWAVVWQAHGFWQVVAGEVLLAVAMSFYSGTNSSLLYDSLLALGRENEFKRLEGRRFSYMLGTVALASLAGGWLYRQPGGEEWPMLLTLVFQVPVIALPLLMVEPPRTLLDEHPNPLRRFAAGLKLAAAGHPEVKWIILLSGVMMATTLTGHWFQQPYWEQLGLDKFWFGVLSAVALSLGALASQMSHRVEALLGARRTVWLLAGLVLLALIVPGLVFSVWVVPVMFAFSLVHGLGRPIINDALHRRVDGKVRATVLSLNGMPQRLLFFALGPLAGAISDAHGLQSAMLSIGLMYLVVMAVVLFSLHRIKLI